MRSLLLPLSSGGWRFYSLDVVVFVNKRQRLSIHPHDVSSFEQMSDCVLYSALLLASLLESNAFWRVGLISKTGRVNETQNRCRFKFESIVRENADGRTDGRTGIFEPEMGMQTSLPESH